MSKSSNSGIPSDSTSRYDASVNRPARFAWFVLVYNVGVILWGAIVRATGSGAGCGSHWPLCNGEVVPRGAGVSTLVEYSHRLTSGAALLLMVGLVAVTFRSRPRGHPARLSAGWSLAFLCGEALVGAGLVLFELVAGNRSLARGLFMATHLVNTFLLLAALTLTAHFLGGGGRLRMSEPRSAFMLLGALGAVLLVGASGAVAALGDTLFPASSLAQALVQDVSATSHVLIRLRLWHPFLALASGAWLIGVAMHVRRRAPLATAARYSRWLITLVLVQTGAGALNVVLLAPVWLQVVHLLLADLVWIVLVLASACALAVARKPVEAAAQRLAPASASSRA
jgi:heme A synthase